MQCLSPLPPLGDVEVEYTLRHELVGLAHLVEQEELLPAHLEQPHHAALAAVAELVHQDVGGLLAVRRTELSSWETKLDMASRFKNILKVILLHQKAVFLEFVDQFV